MGSQKHSRIGIISFTISMFVLLIIIVEAEFEIVFNNKFGGILFALLGIALFAGFCLGIYALMQADRKKIFAILGTIFSPLILSLLFSL